MAAETRPLAGGALGERPRTHAEINAYRRNALMEGAIASLAEHGVAGTTVRTICTAAGASRGLISHYYDSKEELMAAALRHLFDGLADQVSAVVDEAGPSAAARLRAFPVALFSPEVFTERNRTAFLALWHEVRFNPVVRRANRELYLGYIARVEALFREAAVERGVTLDPHFAALGLIALTDGLWLGLSTHGQLMSSDQAAAIALAQIDRELAAGADGSSG